MCRKENTRYRNGQETKLSISADDNGHLYKKTNGGGLDGLLELAILFLGVKSSSPTFGVELTLKKEKPNGEGGPR